MLPLLKIKLGWAIELKWRNCNFHGNSFSFLWLRVTSSLTCSKTCDLLRRQPESAWRFTDNAPPSWYLWLSSAYVAENRKLWATISSSFSRFDRQQQKTIKRREFSHCELLRCNKHEIKLARNISSGRGKVYLEWCHWWLVYLLLHQMRKFLLVCLLAIVSTSKFSCAQTALPRKYNQADNAWRNLIRTI